MSYELCTCIRMYSPSEWPRGLRRGSAAARLLGLRVRIPPGAWMFVCCVVCCVLSGRGVCDEPITRTEESYWLWCVVVCDLETSSRMRRPWQALGCSATKKKFIYVHTHTHTHTDSTPHLQELFPFSWKYLHIFIIYYYYTFYIPDGHLVCRYTRHVFKVRSGQPLKITHKR